MANSGLLRRWLLLLVLIVFLVAAPKQSTEEPLFLFRLVRGRLLRWRSGLGYGVWRLRWSTHYLLRNLPRQCRGRFCTEAEDLLKEIPLVAAAL
jgi:hypothetical protein